jgi:hypothetical protein
MKRWGIIFLPLAAFYVACMVIMKTGHTHYMNPVLRTMYDIRGRGDHAKRCHAQEARQLLEGRSYSVRGWPYRAAVTGDGTNWVLRFDPAPLTPWRRAWHLVFDWNPHPELPCSYELDSHTRVIRTVRADGSVSPFPF